MKTVKCFELKVTEEAVADHVWALGRDSIDYPVEAVVIDPDKRVGPLDVRRTQYSIHAFYTPKPLHSEPSGRPYGQDATYIATNHDELCQLLPKLQLYLDGLRESASEELLRVARARKKATAAHHDLRFAVLNASWYRRLRYLFTGNEKHLIGTK